MSFALSKASKLKADIRLAQAISEFQKDLSTEQKAVFCMTRDTSTRKPPDYQDVMRLTEEIDRNSSRILKSRRCFGTRFTNILHAIQQFAALGDVIVGGSQNILACGVWSLVRMTLLTVVNFSSYLEKLSALLMNVGRSAPRYEMLHHLYPRSKALQSHLSEYFIVVVHICHHLLKMTKKSTFGQLVTFPSDADLKTHETELESISSLIKEEVTLLMGQDVREQNSRIKTILRSTEADAQRERQDTYVRVLNACSTYDYETTWKETRKLGITSWFQQATEYQAWRSVADSATLICTGKLGSGKSVMLANIVGNLNLSTQTPDCPVAYFFCRHDICDSLLSGTVIRSLGRQLLRSIPDLSLVDKRFKRNAPFIDADLVCDVLLNLPRTFQAYFVLDGLDECNDQQRRHMIQQLRKLQDVFNLRICVACRSDVGNLPTLMFESFAKSSLMALPEENPEIKHFIDTELYNCIESGKLVLGDPQLSLDIADALLSGAQGMFLWVALQIEALCAETTDEAIRRALTELPATLQETFSRIIDQSGKQQTGKRYQKRTFELVIAAKRPLTTDELREALSVTPGDDEWNPARHINDIFPVLASCGSLIMVEEENLTVRLIHHSVKQFLLSLDSSMTGGVSPFENAHRTMRATLLTYLNYGVFETQLSTTVAPSIPAQEAPYKIIRSMNTPSTSRNIALRLLKARGQPSIDIGKVVSETMKYTKSQTQGAFKFYSYAKSLWLEHAWLISEDETVAYMMLLKVISRVLGSSTTPDNVRRQILFWAARYGHPRILELCVEHGLDIESRENEMRATPLFWAAANGRHIAVKTLKDHGANLEFKDRSGRTALSFTAGLGLDPTVKALIESGANLETRDEKNWTPLSWAAYNGHEGVVRTLIAKGADMAAVATYYDEGMTPLLLAVNQCHPTIVKILLMNGADSERKLDDVLLITAVRKRHLSTLKMLLEQGVGPNTKTKSMSPLHEAVSHGDEKMIRLLLSHGANPNSRNEHDRTPLVATAAIGQPIDYPLVITLLLKAGADLDIKDDEGKTALWYAALYGEAECVKTLVENGADRNVMATDGSTAFFVGHNPGHIARIKILLDNGFQVDLKDGQGRTPLAYAADCGDVKVAKFLLEHGADSESKDSNGLTPLQIARDEDVIRLLLEERRLRVSPTQPVRPVRPNVTPLQSWPALESPPRGTPIYMPEAGEGLNLEGDGTTVGQSNPSTSPMSESPDDFTVQETRARARRMIYGSRPHK